MGGLGPGAGDALGAALAALAQKERTVAEVAELLERRGFERADAETALDVLIGEGTLDDERFARRYAEDKRDLAGWGNDRIRETLVRRGVGGDVVDEALREPDGEGELARATALVEGRGYDLAEERDRGRAIGLLARRGFDSDVAYEAVRAAERGAAG